MGAARDENGSQQERGANQMSTADNDNQEQRRELATGEVETAPRPVGQAETESLGWLPPSEEQRWGESIPPKRQAELEERLQRWEAEEAEGGAGHGECKSPFDTRGTDGKFSLTGADVFW